ncbi:MAG: hypothetical protein KKE94_10905 [Gammaproteobacteria bacterium]|nr:hypothetical protein [Gammaproteobacteria bacterium]
MAKIVRKVIQKRHAALLRGIYVAVIVGIIAIIVIVTLEPIVAILRDTF